MIITCPECSTRFILDDDLMPEGGRKLKCSNCHAVWHEGGTIPEQLPKEEIEAPDFESPADTADTKTEPTPTEPQSDAPIASAMQEADQAPSAPDDKSAPETMATKDPSPTPTEGGGGGKRALGIIILLLLLAGAGVGAFAYLKPTEFRALIGQEPARKSVVAPKPGWSASTPPPAVETPTLPEVEATPDSLHDTVEDDGSLDSAAKPLPQQ